MVENMSDGSEFQILNCKDNSINLTVLFAVNISLDISLYKLQSFEKRISVPKTLYFDKHRPNHLAQSQCPESVVYHTGGSTRREGASGLKNPSPSQNGFNFEELSNKGTKREWVDKAIIIVYAIGEEPFIIIRGRIKDRGSCSYVRGLWFGSSRTIPERTRSFLEELGVDVGELATIFQLSKSVGASLN
ncbi:unnamed protein product [Nezara viridula]|uniref:Uncharacterized protein n=1 Tax=Nezara viridula TaxID=85310 RepID=A0A9P0MSI5_NEZVI|nr:unnamed protein product [Nezara viridula]